VKSKLHGKLLDDKADFNKLVCQERVDRIVEAAQFYGWDSGRVKGLIFCSRIEECHKLSEEFNKRGYDTIALDGSSSEELREKSIERLEQDELENKLDYIFTVDIFNEGVDIPFDQSNHHVKTNSVCDYICTAAWQRAPSHRR
jgi:superfamily II DNA or RNA helicase